MAEHHRVQIAPLDQQTATTQQTAAAELQQTDKPEQTAELQQIDKPEQTAELQQIDKPEPTAELQQTNKPEQTAEPQQTDINETRVCYNCGKRGHVVPSCPVPRARGRLPFAPRKVASKPRKATTKFERIINCKSINGGNFYFK